MSANFALDSPGEEVADKFWCVTPGEHTNSLQRVHPSEEAYDE